jgi:hypothetical protein
MAPEKRFVMPAEAGIQQASGSEPKNSFASADADALDSRFRGNDRKNRAASLPVGRA